MSYRTCNTCTRRATCTAICASLERRLPNEHTGRLAVFNRAHRKHRAERLEARRRYVRFLLDYRGELRGRMRRAFDLRYNEGMSVSQIALRLGVAPSTAGEYLRRARAQITARAGVRPPKRRSRRA